MNILFFYFLSFVLIADGLMIFLTPVVVYMLTGSIAYSGLSYTIWWLPRLFLIPIIGKFIDNLGVRPLSILSDCIKTAGCLFLIFYQFDDPIIISIAFGIVGSLISIGNSQTIIAYEKIISLLSQHKEKHVNLMSRIDFLGMIIGSALGILFIDFGYKYLLMLVCCLYFFNAIYFFYVKINDHHQHEQNNLVTEQKSTISSLGFIFTSPIIICIILLSVGNNMFDGLIESSGTAIIDKEMNLPIKYFGLIDIAAGIFGFLGTYLYGAIYTKIARAKLLLIGLLFIIIPSIILIFSQKSLFVFIACYAATIIGKVFSGNINRITRIEIIPEKILASTSSLIVFFNQSILPIVGMYLFFFGESNGSIQYVMIISVLITFLSGCLLIKKLSA